MVAEEFLSNHRGDHKELQADINILAGIKNHEQMKVTISSYFIAVGTYVTSQENEFTRTLRQRKHVIQMCSTSFELMMNFLVVL